MHTWVVQTRADTFRIMIPLGLRRSDSSGRFPCSAFERGGKIISLNQ